MSIFHLARQKIGLAKGDKMNQGRATKHDRCSTPIQSISFTEASFPMNVLFRKKVGPSNLGANKVGTGL